MNKLRREILLLEDDELFANTLVDFLGESGFSIDWVDDGEKALELSYKNCYNLFLFDINVPKLNGIKLLQELRKSGEKTPTIFLTSYKDENTLSECFISGCDDYIRKPFNVSELVLRINAVLKRTSRIENKAWLSSSIYYDFDSRRVYENSIEIPLPLKVVQLLELFIEKDGQIIKTDEIIDRLWSSNEEHSDGSIRLYIAKIRMLVGKDVITNIKKIGYKISNLVKES